MFVHVCIVMWWWYRPYIQTVSQAERVITGKKPVFGFDCQAVIVYCIGGGYGRRGRGVRAVISDPTVIECIYFNSRSPKYSHTRTWSDGVAQLVERRTRGPKTRGSNLHLNFSNLNSRTCVMLNSESEFLTCGSNTFRFALI